MVPRQRITWMSQLTFSALLCLLFCNTALAYCPSYMRNQTACSCEEYVDGAIIKCSGPKGPLVVENLKKLNVEVRELVLENANIIEIGPRAFVGMRIKKLVLDNNKIKMIQKNAFRGLESILQELSIVGNRLTEVPTTALDGLRALNTLNLRCNRIGNITDVAFMNMPSLIEVHLGCNKICNISADAFREVKQSLQNIILDKNCLEEMPTKALEEMNALIALHLKYNQIEELGPSQLRNMTNLSLLSLKGNQIGRISPNFTANVPNLRYIYLAENQIEKIEPGAMKQFVAAEIMDLSYNNIGNIGADIFNGMENLQQLNLEANAIREVTPGAFATTPLLLLWLPHNCIQQVSPTMFQGVPFLKQVSLASNNIRSVQPFSFAHLANLHTLDLSNNKIKSIQPSAILGSDFLTVRVQENPLVCLQDGFHVMNGREAINLTTEANLICQTDYDNDNTDKCPRKPEPPVSKICCEASQKSSLPTEATTTQMQTVTSVGPVSSSSSPSASPTFLPQSLESAKTTAAKTQERQLAVLREVQPADVPVSVPPLPSTAEPRGKARARQLNMERFYRLSRRPELMSPFASSSRHSKILASAQGKKDLVDLSKDIAHLPPHVAALVNGQGVAKAATKPSKEEEERKSSKEEERKSSKEEEERKSSKDEDEEKRDEEGGGGEAEERTEETNANANKGTNAKANNGANANGISSTKTVAKQMSTTEIRKGAFPTAPYIDSMPDKMSKHRHEHLQPNGEFSRDTEPTHVQVEQKKPEAEHEVVAKQ